MRVLPVALLVLSPLRSIPFHSAVSSFAFRPVLRSFGKVVPAKNRLAMSDPTPSNVKSSPPDEQKRLRDGSHIVACHEQDYEKLLSAKVDRLRELLSWQKDIDVFESPRSHYRMRANFQMWHDNPKNKVPSGFHYIMYDDDKSWPCEVKSFPRGRPLISKLMNELMTVFSESKVLFDNLFEVRFLTTQTDEAVVVLCYKRPLSPAWQAAAEEVCKKLKIKIIGRARKQKETAGGDETVVETLCVHGINYKFYQTEGAFSQPNAVVCEKMISWVMDRTAGSENEDLLELYCGGGTFTAPLSKNFRNVLATEISKASVDLAVKTFALNGIQNIKIARLSSEEFTEAYSGNRSFARVAEAGIDLKSYNITTVLVDPPRAGLDLQTCVLISQFDKIVYISCNPETLARDIQILSKTHNIERVAAFDQFPYTHHLEAGVYLVAKTLSEETEEAPEKKARLA